MNDDLGDLYQELILDHGRHPRNHRVPPGANRESEGYNPLCGDRCHVHLVVDAGVVRDAGFTGKGCAISTAAASTMTEAVKGRTLAEVERMFQGFHDLVTGKPGAKGDDLGKLAAFAGVSAFPMRVKCATLPWHTLRAALRGGGEVVTTE
jgi:nitrogen fixation NifU-like protein